MAERDEEAKKNVVDTTPPEGVETENLPIEEPRDVDTCVENQMPSQQKKEEIIKNKYGGLLAKKSPLISKLLAFARMLTSLIRARIGLWANHRLTTKRVQDRPAPLHTTLKVKASINKMMVMRTPAFLQKLGICRDDVFVQETDVCKIPTEMVFASRGVLRRILRWKV